MHVRHRLTITTSPLKFMSCILFLSVDCSSNVIIQFFIVTEQAADKPTALKLVLKVGAPYTPTDATSADSQSESVDNDSEKKTKTPKKKQQSDKVDHQDKKVL